MKPEVKALAKQYGINLARAGAEAFCEWLLTRPRILKRPMLVKILKVLSGL